MLESILTKTNQKIIAFLADYPQQQFFGSELAKKTRVSLGGTHQILKKLVARGLVLAEKKGRMIFYQINSHHPLIKQIKTTQTVSHLTKLVAALKDFCQQIILFGSAARGENTAESDLDLFILTNNPEVVREIMNKKSGRLPIVPVIKTVNQWAELEAKDPEFFQEVKQGIILYQKNE